MPDLPDCFSDGLNRYAAETACVASGRHTLPLINLLFHYRRKTI